MRKPLTIFLSGLLAILVVDVAALAIYDLSRENRIAKGVRVGTIYVGGLEASQAHALLVRELEAGLQAPVVVRGAERTFELTPQDARATYDIGGMVDAAVRRSREGNLFTRSWRDLRGERLSVRLPADLQYSRDAVNAFVRRVDDAVSRKPKDAHLEFSNGYPRKRPGKDGLDVRHADVRSDVLAALTGTAPDRVVHVKTRRVKPDLVKAELDDAYPLLITVDRPSFKLRFFRRLKHVETYTIAVGAVGFDTPSGMYHIQNKAVNAAWSVPNKPWAGELAGQVIPGGSPQNPLKARWMGIYNGAGIHGTDQVGSLGSRASHGCIRMAIPDVIELYDRVEVQTPVYIA